MPAKGGPGWVLAQGRNRARRMALQALYQWQIARQDLSEIETQFLVGPGVEQVDVTYFRELIHEIPAVNDTLQEAVDPLLDRPMVQLDPVERAILWIGAYELLHRPDIPYKVVINEGVDLAKTFGADQGHKFVNGVLDRLARVIRSREAG